MRASSAYSLFDTESVWAILMRIAPPVMLAQLIQAMYNIVDSYFVAKISEEAMTASFPVTASPPSPSSTLSN